MLSKHFHLVIGIYSAIDALSVLQRRVHTCTSHSKSLNYEKGYKCQWEEDNLIHPV